MRPNNTRIRWIAAASCLLAITSVASADEGVVRITDSNQRSGVTRIGTNANAQLTPEQQEQQAAYARIRAQLAQQSSPNGQFRQVGFQTQTPHMYQPQNSDMFQQASYGMQGCGTGHCGSAACGQGMTYGNCDSACPSGQCGGSACGNCQSGHCGCDNGKNRRGRNDNNCQSCDDCYADGYNERMCTLFAKAAPDDGCSRWCHRWWQGQTNNYQARNQKLSNHLFGWMVPSGCCPPFGKYHVTYANDPGYADSRDGQVYGAQGYGTHMNVPLAPNVRQSYNYSWGTPASRITPIGHYAGPGPATANNCQTW